VGVYDAYMDIYFLKTLSQKLFTQTIHTVCHSVGIQIQKCFLK